MKKTSIVLAFCLGVITFGQVGLNTVNPAATLDITAKSSTGNTSSPEGLLLPRVDRERAQSMTEIKTSTLIYVENISTGSQTGTAVNIDNVGYYYFDGTVWTKLIAGESSGDSNIYNSNGTLTDNRVVTQGTNTLSFKASSVNAFSVADNTFSVDAQNSRVGIGTTTPSNKLTIQGVNAQPNYTNAILRVDGNSNHALDFGTFAEAPFGAYISSNNKQDKAMPLILNPLGSSVGIGTIKPATSAILDLYATNKGFLPPRLTTAQRDAINPKVAGMMIYNSSVNIMQYWNGSIWQNYQ